MLINNNGERFMRKYAPNSLLACIKRRGFPRAMMTRDDRRKRFQT